MLPLHTQLAIAGTPHRSILKVLTPAEALAGDWQLDSCLALEPDETVDLTGWAGSLTYGEQLATGPGVHVSRVQQPEVIQAGDVVRLDAGRGRAHVVYRRGSRNNFLFATDRCNNYCLMCSQPPLEVEDAWRVRDMIQTVLLVDREEHQLGITGGEPTLLGQGLADVLAACSSFLPETHIHILTNGRNFADPAVAELLGLQHPERVMWAVPLYADHARAHDHVVQAKGAFDETMAGLYQLAARGLRIELRVVLHRLTVPRLGALAHFIYRNLPFVAHVALMGLEPMGFTPLNREQLWIDPVDYMPALSDATFHLANRGMNVSIYNLPLCVLPQALWPFARQSISDWKNTFAPECAGCEALDRCAGFFKSAGPAWRSRAIAPLHHLPAATGTGHGAPMALR